MSKLIVANWKMNGTLVEAHDRAVAIATAAQAEDLAARLVLCPPFPHLPAAIKAVEDSPVTVGAQDCHWEPKGAFTGDVSVAMLAEIGCGFVIVGHSERRHGKGETDDTIRKKATAVQASGLRPIVCVGETLVERESARAEAVVGAQLAGSLPSGAASLIVAYEPVWAIGTGKVASLADVRAMHRFIQSEVAKLHPGVPLVILYGGSVSPDNAAEIMALDEVDGALVGGASLKAESFLAIARSVPQA